jgi:hypothetical protein
MTSGGGAARPQKESSGWMDIGSIIGHWQFVIGDSAEER